MFFKLVSFVVGLATLTIVNSAMSARAETPSTDLASGQSEVAKPAQVVVPPVKPAVTKEPLAVESISAFERLEAAQSAQVVVSSVKPAITNDPLAVDSSAAVERLEATKPVQVVVPSVKPAVTDDRLVADSSAAVERLEATKPVQVTAPSVKPVATFNPLTTNPTVTPIPDNTVAQRDRQPTNLADTNQHQTNSQRQQPEAIRNNQQPSSAATTDVSVAEPTLERLETSAAPLKTQAAIQPNASPVEEASSEPSDNTLAQTDIDVGRRTRGGFSYIAVGGNIGLGGGSALGDGAFGVSSKLGLTRYVSFRPGVIIGDETAFLLPVTYDFVIQAADPFEPVRFAPYVGGGAAVTTEGDVGFLVTGGVDVPISREFVANGAINVDFGSDTNVGLFVGIGYTFPGFRR